MEFMNKKRWLFVLSHAATAFVIATALIYTYKAFGITIAAIAAATLCLIFKEFGEGVGKKKATNEFANTAKGNVKEFWDAINDKWQLMQTVGAAAIAGVVLWIF